MVLPFPKLNGRGEFGLWTWEKRSQWPSDWDDKVFLGRALDRVGRAKFGNDWTGRDPEGIPNIKPLPEEWTAATDHVRGSVQENGWLAAVEGREEHRRLARASYSRWNEVTDILASALRGRDLPAFGRGKKSTAFIRIERDAFNLDDMRPLFKDLTIRIQTSFMDITECWIFLNASAVEKLASGLGHHSTDGERRPTQAHAQDDELNALLDETKAKLLELRAEYENRRTEQKSPKGRWPVLTTAAVIVAKRHASEDRIEALSKRIRRNFPDRHPGVEAKQPYYLDRMPAPKRGQ